MTNTLDLVHSPEATLVTLAERFDNGQIKPRQYEMVVREILRTIAYAVRTRQVKDAK